LGALVVMGWEVPSAASVVGPSWVALVATTIVRERPVGVVISGLTASLAGFLEKARAEVEHARAEVLAERNHLERSTMSSLTRSPALSIKLEALDTLAGQEHASPVRPFEHTYDTMRFMTPTRPS
jgi:hypothetical protein